ncbi:uncharacterized protein F5891DRAFT_1197914 [Suillus fuscotomentosus]|uniref:Uncharacterized protein n=1 Tax=Suillus fuscotomentosus TaxID=1912939 RepID=A0AAD4DR49_9AGAM|nr:uncharacterized protein F5891DRAFT_1197914 [Suillus fuscotomentosus]KAG1890637.1 hypothetical protein F5891DRAFT_1197914 [Suillus fuscotomentosus]
MAPPKWTLVEQEAWLQPWYKKSKAKQSKKNKNYKNFFANLRKQWFEEFPEPRLVHITQVGPLTLSEEGEIGVARDTCKAKLCTQFKNSLGGSKMGRKAKADTTSVINAVVRSIAEYEKPMCMLQEQEAYSKLFYVTCVQPTIQGSLKAIQEHRTLTNGERVALVKETAVLYAQESPDIKDQVKQYLEDQKQQRLQNKLEGWSQMTDYSRNLNKLAVVANSFLKGLTEVTGMLFSLLAGGPSPKAHGAIDVYRLSTAEASISRPQESSSETGGLLTLDSNDLDIYGSDSKLLSFWDVSESGTSGSIPDPLSTGDASLWFDVQSVPHEPNRSLDQFLQTPILPEPLTMTPSYGDDWTTPDLDVFLSNLDVQMGLGPLAGASKITTLTMPTLPLASPPGTSTPPPDTSLSIPPAISHSPQWALTMPTLLPDTSLNVLSAVSRTPQLALTMSTFLPTPASPPGTTSPPDTGLSILSAISHTSQWTETPSTSELPPASTTHSLDVAPTLGNECLDELDVNTDKDGPALETRRTKRIPKPSTHNDTANVIGCPREENKHPRALAETSSGHGSKKAKV